MEKLKEHIQSVVSVYKSGNLSKAEILTKELINNNPKILAGIFDDSVKILDIFESH